MSLLNFNKHDGDELSAGEVNRICAAIDEHTRKLDEINGGAATDFNKPMPSIHIDGQWLFYRQDGSSVSVNFIDPVPDSRNPVLENGYQAKFVGTYTWESREGTKAPQGVDSRSFFKDLPSDGIPSDVHESGMLSSDTSIIARVKAPKTGLVVQGGNVVPATGDDFAEASVKVSFRHRKYFGIASTNSVSEQMIKGLENNILTNSKGGTVNNLTVPRGQYYVYAYPEALGELSGILQGAYDVMGAFVKSTVYLVNAAGKRVLYNVYVSEFDGAFNDVKQLKFLE